MPRTQKIAVCIPDTNSLIHLRDVKIVGRDACLWLWDEFEIKIGEKIREEVRDKAAHNPALKVSSIDGRLTKSIVELDFDLDAMERCFLDKLGVDFTPGRDLGERTNSQVALQLLVQSKARNIIFLTDELKCVRENEGFVWKIFNTYPVGIIWNALDFLLYLYMRHKRFLYEQALDVIRLVNIKIGGKNEEATKRLAKYTKSLQLIQEAKAKLPGLWNPAR
jgi:hypothetical protein